MEALQKTAETTFRDVESQFHRLFYGQEAGATEPANTVSNKTVVVADLDAKHFFRRYNLGEKIGQGRQWKMFKAKAVGSPDDSTTYAIKRVGRFWVQEKYQKALLEEVKTLRMLDHPNVVKIRQYFPHEMRFHYVVLEYMAGGELLDRVVKKESYSEQVVRDLCRVMISTLKYVHDNFFVHRRIESSCFKFADPSDEASSLKLTQFGSACSVREGPVTTHVVTEEYVAPEILLGKPHRVSVDMWSIGVLVYVLLAGDLPFYHNDTTKMFLRIAAGDYDLNSDKLKRVSSEAKELMSRLLTVDSSRRITADEALGHPWMVATGASLAEHELNINLKGLKLFHAKRKLKAAIHTFLAAKMLLGSITPNQPDANFSGVYELGKKLGEGAFAQVFVAIPRFTESSLLWDLGSDGGSSRAARDYAVKRIDRTKLAEEDKKSVHEEVRILGDLDHPNVINIYNFYENDPQYFYMILELMSGGELLDRIVEKTYYNEEEARDLCRVLLGAVKYIHDQGVVHRDLKPENLLLASKTDDTSIRLADFGFACSVHDRLVAEQCGTPCYVAPEILRLRPYGRSVDMWSTGVIIFVILSGYLPFQDQNQGRLFRKIKSGHFKFEPPYWDSVSEEAKDFVRKLLVVDPSKRLTADQAINHPWLATEGEDLATNDLGVGLNQLRIFNATRKLRAAIQSVVAAKRIAKRLGVKYAG